MSDTKPVYEFGAFRLDVAERRLTRANGELLTVPPKAFDLLVYLLENPNHLLAKDELMDKVWADSFVEEGNLKLHVHSLRKVFNDGGEKFIETVPRRGYRFNADVRDIRGDELLVEKITRGRMVIEQTIGEPSAGALTGSRTHSSYLAAGLLAVLLIAGGVFVYARYIRPGSGKVAAGSETTAIAVLPFKNLTKDDRDEFLGVGLADSLITRLSSMRQLAVRPTSAVIGFAGTPEEAADRLHVENIIEGTVQRVGERVRISVQLVRAKDQQMLWAKSFDLTGADLIAIQDSITTEVADSLLKGLSPSDQTILAKRETNDPQANELYIKGRFLWNKRTVPDLKRSAELFQQATERDANFSLAYVGLADSYQLLAEYGGMNPPEAIELARTAVKRALAINDNSAEAHASLGYMLAFYDWKWPDAEREFKRAIELNPNYSTARQWYGEYLVAYSRMDEASAETRRAEELDPTSPIIQTDLVAIDYLSRRFDQAAAGTSKILELDPKFMYAYAYRWIAYEQAGQTDKAAESILILDSVAYPPEIVAQERAVYAAGGWKALWQWKYDRLEQPPFDKLSDYVRAMAAVRAGNSDRAFEYLGRSAEKHDRWFVNLNSDPQWDPIRQDPRFAQLVSRLGR